MCKALEAGEFLKSLSYLTQKEALGIVRDGNVKNIPYTANDVNRFFDIYGPQVAGVRGRTMKRIPSNTAELDQGAKMQLTLQERPAGSTLSSLPQKLGHYVSSHTNQQS